MTTQENLEAAFAGESQANRRYLAFAQRADQEGYTQIAKLYRAVAAAETVHALTHFGIMRGVGNTSDNLKKSIAGEIEEFKVMYPKFIEQAKAEGASDAVILTFDVANKVEKIHAGLFQRALDNLGKNIGKNQVTDYYVCNICGNTVEGSAPQKCPICHAPHEMFEKID